jgi:hypothetical protein
MKAEGNRCESGIIQSSGVQAQESILKRKESHG